MKLNIFEILSLGEIYSKVIIIIIKVIIIIINVPD